MSAEVRMEQAGLSVVAPASHISQYEQYLAFLRTALRIPGSTPVHNAADVVRESIELMVRRRHGVFFTPATLAETLTTLVEDHLDGNTIVMDPSCGAGDLLIAAANKFPLRNSLEATLTYWGRMLWGRDIDPRFVEAARLRLMLLASARHGNCARPLAMGKCFPNIEVGDSSAPFNAPRSRCVVLLNPPFHTARHRRSLAWSSGIVNHAAVHLESAISSVPRGSRIAAILPEVLRCGTRYAKFRRTVVLSRTTLLNERDCGQFDQWADVHVYQALLIVGAPRVAQPSIGSSGADHTIGSVFDVRVGPVVPHRDPERGPWSPYITAHNVPIGATGYVPRTHRRYYGTLFAPPFVVVRRTSRPDSKRAAASVIRGEKPVAVENHLIVLKPRTGALRECRELANYLNSPSVDGILDKTLRCRHLTVGSIMELPWPTR